MDTARTLGAETPERLLHRLEWQVIRRLDGMLQGSYRTMFRGVGTDFRDLREYEPGDDVRHIDWNVTARMDTPFIRQFSEDRELTAWLLLDRSPSMGFGPIDRPKELVLCELATTFARLLTRGGNRVGAILFDNEVESTLPPRSSRNQVLALARNLMRPPGSHGAITDLAGLLESAHGTIRRRSLVVLMSDFITAPGWERPLLQLTERHEVVAIRLLDPREYELPDAGVIVVEDAETGEQLTVDSSDAEFRHRLRAAGEDREAELRAATLRAGVDIYEVSTEDDLVTALVRIVESAEAAAAADVARLAVDAARLALRAGRSCSSTGGRSADARAARPGSPPKGSCRPTRRAARPPAAPHPLRPLRRRARAGRLRAGPTDDDDHASRARRHRDPRLRRLEQHARRGSRADPDRGREGGRAGVRRAAAADDPDRRRRVRRQRRHRAPADEREGGRDQRRSTASR